MNAPARVALIGAGSMGGALLRGWLNAGAMDMPASAIFDPSPPDDVAQLAAARAIPINPDADMAFDAVVLAVKPQIAAEILPGYKQRIGDAVVVSVMAGVTLDRIAQWLGGEARAARAMPNLPAAVGKGVAGVYAQARVTAAERQLIDTLLSGAGGVVWVDEERAIDAVTAISGSGPAYFFLLAEALGEAGVALGLAPDAAARLARETLIGAGALLDADDRDVAAMRAAVTSPGGTTAAALDVLDGDQHEIRTLIKTAAAAAARRARALSG